MKRLKRTKKLGAVTLALVMVLALLPAVAPGARASNQNPGTVYTYNGWRYVINNAMPSPQPYGLGIQEVTIVGYNGGGVNLVVPDNVGNRYIVTGIDVNTFYGNTTLQTVLLPGKVSWIADYAFLGCTALQRITIPGSVTQIGKGTFYGCTSLQEVTIPGSVVKIEEYAFYDCISLGHLDIPDSVTDIGLYALSYVHPDWGTVPLPNLKIYCSPGSAAQGYAMAYNIPYQLPKRTVSIRFNSRGGSSVVTQTVSLSRTVNRPPNPTRLGYVFRGWYRTAKCKTKWNFKANTVERNRTLYAGWKRIQGQVTSQAVVPKGGQVVLRATGNAPISTVSWKVSNKNRVSVWVSGSKKMKCTIRGRRSGNFKLNVTIFFKDGTERNIQRDMTVA